MSQPWFGQQGPSMGASNPPQQPPGNMHHQRFLHVNATAPSAMANQGPASTYARSSPPVARPPSSASVGSASSYHSAPGPAPGPGHASMNRPQGHVMEQGPRNPGPHAGHPHGVHGGIRPMVSGRYPMPPRNGMVHPVRPVPRGPMPLRQHHGMHPSGSISHPRHGSGLGQPGRQGPNGMGPSDYGHSGHSQFGAKPGNVLGRPGHAPMQHTMPYRQPHSMGGPGGAPHGYHQGSHQGSHQGNYSQMGHRHMPPQHSEQNYQPYPNRNPVESSSLHENQAVSRSPSPPPAPPILGNHHPTNKPSAPEVSEGPEASSVGPLRERQNVQPETQSGISQRPAAAAHKPEDVTADAASILLQLSAVVKKGVENHNLGQDASMGNQENKPSNCSTDNIGHSNSMKPPARVLAGIEESHSHDDVSTIAPSETTDSAPDLTSEPSSDSIEHESDFPAPIPENYPTRLALPYDDSKLNSLHCFLRSELLEIFVVQKSLNKSPTHSPGSSVGRVGLRCVHCAFNKRQRDDRDEAPMAVFYPKSIAEIYRLVTSWQRCHLRKCRNLPPAVRSKWQLLRDNDKSRGKTHYWITSAKEIGLIDCQSRAGGIRFRPQLTKNAALANQENEKDISTSTGNLNASSSETTQMQANTSGKAAAFV